MKPAWGSYCLEQAPIAFFDIQYPKSLNAVLVSPPKNYFETEYPPFFASESGKRYRSNVSVKAKLVKGLATRSDLLLAIQEQTKASYDLQDARSTVIQAHADLTASLGISPSYSLQQLDLSKLPLPAGLVQPIEKIVGQA
jgi:hypothetical protein